MGGRTGGEVRRRRRRRRRRRAGREGIRITSQWCWRNKWETKTGTYNHGLIRPSTSVVFCCAGQAFDAVDMDMDKQEAESKERTQNSALDV